MATVDLELQTNLKKATADLANFSKKAGGSLDGLKASFRTLGAVAGAAVAAFGVRKITQAASEQEQAVKSLNTALALTGEFTQENSKRFQEFASELQKNSTVGDEVTLSLIGLTKSMGATNEQTEKIIQAATDLSAVTGESLETSVRNITKTLGGMKGELGETQPELRNLTAEQLRAGAAIDILNEKYKGSAKELTNTFGGAVQQAKNSFGDLLEEVGNLIIKNPVVIAGIKELSRGFTSLGTLIKENRSALINLTVDGLVAAIRGISLLTTGVGQLGTAFLVVEDNINRVILLFAQGRTKLIEFLAGIRSGFDDIGLGFLFKSVIPEEADRNKKALSELAAEAKVFENAASKAFTETNDTLTKTDNAFASAAGKIDDFADSLDKMKTVSNSAKTSLEQLSDANQQLTTGDGSVLDIINAFRDKEFKFNLFGKDDGRITGAGILRAGALGADALAQGAKGAQSLAKTGVTAGVTALFGPEIGQGVGSIFGLLAQGPEQTRAMVQGFIDEIPAIIDNLAEAAPVFVEALAENADKIILALVNATPRFAEAIAIEVPKALARALPGALQRVLNAFAIKAAQTFRIMFDALSGAFTPVVNALQGIVRGFGNLRAPELNVSIRQDVLDKIKGSIANGLKDAAEGLGEAFLKPIKAFFESLDPTRGASAGGGGGGGTAARVQAAISTGGASEAKNFVRRFKRAQGGEVPPGYPNDTFPAALTSGENVVDRSTNEKLNAFLDSGGGTTTVVLQVGEKQLAEVLLNLNRQGFRTA